jgi:tetratricopeptide (TPR) repeat protein
MQASSFILKRGMLFWLVALMASLLVSCSQPVPGQALADKAQTEVASGDLDGAIKDYSQAISQSPNDATFYQARGYAQLLKNQLDLALDDFNRAIALDPNYDMAYNNRGYVYNIQNQLDKSLVDYNKAIAL